MHDILGMDDECGHCGKRCKVVDVYTPFGHSEMMKPPDDVYLCQVCANRLYESTLKSMRGKKRAALHWRASEAERRAAKEAGMIFAGPPMAAWCEAFARDSVPDGWKVWE
jgi:hypothetical protein